MMERRWEEEGRRGDQRRRIHEVFFHLQHLGNHAENVEMNAVRQEKVPKLNDLVESAKVQARGGLSVSLLSALQTFSTRGLTEEFRHRRS